jgi:hypothetical protein
MGQRRAEGTVRDLVVLSAANPFSSADLRLPFIRYDDLHALLMLALYTFDKRYNTAVSST